MLLVVEGMLFELLDIIVENEGKEANLYPLCFIQIVFHGLGPLPSSERIPS